jgi:hypothetical protein
MFFQKCGRTIFTPTTLESSWVTMASQWALCCMEAEKW